MLSSLYLPRMANEGDSVPVWFRYCNPIFAACVTIAQWPVMTSVILVIAFLFGVNRNSVLLPSYLDQIPEISRRLSIPPNFFCLSGYDTSSNSTSEFHEGIISTLSDVFLQIGGSSLPHFGMLWSKMTTCSWDTNLSKLLTFWPSGFWFSFDRCSFAIATNWAKVGRSVPVGTGLIYP